jgi:hypothetical protein
MKQIGATLEHDIHKERCFLNIFFYGGREMSAILITRAISGVEKPHKYLLRFKLII